MVRTSPGRRLLLRPFTDGFQPRWNAVGNSNAKGRMLPGVRRPFAERTNETSRGGMVLKPSGAHQPVVVRITYAERHGRGADARREQVGKVREYGAYITRTMDVDGPPVDRDGVVENWQEKIEPWVDDRRLFRMSVNPLNGNDIQDWPGYIRDVMAEVERRVLSPAELDAGQHIDWIASVHTDTGRAHAHVAVRGRAGDEDLRFDRDFIYGGITRIAREVANRDRHLGPYLGDDAERKMEGLERQVPADPTERFTPSIDLEPEMDRPFTPGGFDR